MKWILNDNIPIWPQLKEQIMRAIISGEYPSGSSFPTVRQLAEEAGVNRNTMQRALSELETDGLLATNRTAGRTVTSDMTLICKTKKQLAQSTINNYFKEMETLGFTKDEALSIIINKESE